MKLLFLKKLKIHFQADETSIAETHVAKTFSYAEHDWRNLTEILKSKMHFKNSSSILRELDLKSYLLD